MSRRQKNCILAALAVVLAGGLPRQIPAGEGGKTAPKALPPDVVKAWTKGIGRHDELARPGP
jgi:hypothetical protein